MLTRLIQDIPLNAFGTLLSQGKATDDIKRELILAYREKLRNAYEHYQEQAQTAPPELIATLSHLSRLTDRWITQ